MTSRPTPLTDAFVAGLIPSARDGKLGLNPYISVAADIADHARRLEREHAELIEALSTALECADNGVSAIAWQEQARALLARLGRT